jgi:hypothetical protein
LCYEEDKKIGWAGIIGWWISKKIWMQNDRVTKTNIRENWEVYGGGTSQRNKK